MRIPLIAAIPTLLCGMPLHAQVEPVLPPVPEWSGASESWIVRPGDPWITPAEETGFARTPSYDETRAWLEKLVGESPLLTKVTFGTSAEGRELYYVRASTAAKEGRPVVLVQAGIHSHEISGKDAGLMLLRDIALGGKEDLLGKVDLVFVPIYNVDGHEQVSRFNAPHLRGPANSGSRNTAQRINLNRDYAKAAAPETRALLPLLRQLDPVLYLDMHASDGFDHGYDVTYTYAGWGRHVQSPAIAEWLQGSFEDGVNAFVRQQGHNPHFYPSALDDYRIDKGLRMSAEGPRYSTGYGDFARIPVVLVEMHNLKPYRQRVLGVYAMMEGALRTAAASLPQLQSAIAIDRSARPKTLTVKWARDEQPFTTISFTGMAFERVQSLASGAEEIRYLGQEQQWELPVTGEHPVSHVTLPEAWWVPAAERDVIALLDLHGISYERIDTARDLTLEMATASNMQLGPIYDAEARMSADFRRDKRNVRMAAGSIRVPYDQPRGLLAAALLEPEAVDSVFSWGFFPELMENSGSRERFLLAPVAERMLESDPELRDAFEQRLASDATFAADPQARLKWFAEKSPYFAAPLPIYPIGRELKDQ
ncbi:carboxypeptidase [Altererythrobacter indicus]|uniref:Carboxypeptidase n=1 Tax=Altericroceibacterium indicum TaxID=374177 RepID=A0A845AEJ3_9SPHN|nr:M14 family metallopeptidase [Altericroceibacterium indicum]MXP25588.1 carboxypeptidase [Altericroceibacterium indicum]